VSGDEASASDLVITLPPDWPLYWAGHANLFGGDRFTPQCVGAESRRSHLRVSFCAIRVSFGLVLP
jgi:hypothetical protein